MTALVSAGVESQESREGPVVCDIAAQATINLNVRVPHGSLHITGWDKDSVVVRGTRVRRENFYCAGGSGAAKLGVQVANAKLGIDAPSAASEPPAADLYVYMPRRGMVSARTVDADITASDIGGIFYSAGGSIRLNGQVTSADVESLNGNLDLNVTTPWIKARGGSGHLLLRGQPQDADVSTVSGTLSIAASSILRGQFSSVSGDIHYAAMPLPAAIFEFSNHAGTVDLFMPESTSAALTLSSVTGRIENGFARVRPTTGPSQSVRVNLGRGEAQVSVRTFKGTIRLRSQ